MKKIGNFLGNMRSTSIIINFFFLFLVTLRKKKKIQRKLPASSLSSIPNVFLLRSKRTLIKSSTWTSTSFYLNYYQKNFPAKNSKKIFITFLVSFGLLRFCSSNKLVNALCDSSINTDLFIYINHFPLKISK